MSITLDGTNGITTPDVDSTTSVTTPLVTNAGTLALSATGANIVTASTNGAERLRVDASGNVGVGTNSPNGALDVRQDAADGTTLRLVNTGSASNSRALLRLVSQTSNFGGGLFQTNGTDSSYATSALSLYTFDAQPLVFGTSNNERARIDTSGRLLVGTTDPDLVLTSGTHGCAIHGNIGFIAVNRANDTSAAFGRTTSTGSIVEFYYNGVSRGSISTNGTNVSYNTSSDYRLKEDVQPIVGSVNRLMALKPVNFAWKEDGSRVDGFLAHEAQEVVPECVTGEKNQVQIVEIKDEDGNVTGTEERPVYQGIDQSKIVPLLVAALQEAMAEIAELKADVAALKGA